MKLSRQERDALRESFRKMGPAAKAEHIFTYYKAPIAAVLVVLILLGSAVHHFLTKKETLVCVGLLNVSVGEDVEARLTSGFLTELGLSPSRNRVQLLSDLYVSDDPAAENHEYAYASRMKLLASINSRQLDVVLMNREAYDLFSRSGYLMDLAAALPGQSPELARRLGPALIENEVILEDNALAVQLGEESAYRFISEDSVNGIDLCAFAPFRDAGFTDRVYIGVIANSARPGSAFQYLDYLTSG